MLNVDYERLLLIPREGKIKTTRKRRRRVGSGTGGQGDGRKRTREGGTKRKEQAERDAMCTSTSVLLKNSG